MYRTTLLLLSTLVFVPAASAVHDTAPDPGVDFTFSDDLGPGGTRLMYQEGGDDAPAQPVFIGSNCLVFVNSEPETLAGVIPPQPVDFRVEFDAATSIEGVTVTIGKLAGTFIQADPGGDSDEGSASLTLSLGVTSASGTITTYGGQSLDVGDRVAARVCLDFVNETTGGSGLISANDHGSFVTFQNAPPPPIIPELSTLLLTGVGAASVAGLAFVGRRREL